MYSSLAPTIEPAILFPRSVEEALLLLEENPGDGRIIAGGTWLMRAGIRGERLPAKLVSLERIENSAAVARRDNGWRLGPMVTHDAVARRLEPTAALTALVQAASRSANPGVRRLATVGGNLATTDFAAADIVPALIALDASVMVVDKRGTRTLRVEDFVRERSALSSNYVIGGVDIEDDGGLSAHARLTMRRAGEYPVAIVSVAAKFSGDRLIEQLRIAIGSVERTPRRWRDLERQLVGAALDLTAIEAAAAANLAALTPRSGADAPPWYRLEVLPHLVRTAFADIRCQVES